MKNYIVKFAETENEIKGKAYVHYKSWQETYQGLVDTKYLEKITLEKCMGIAHKSPDNILIAKDKEKVIGFVCYGAYRDNTLTDCGEIYAIYVLQEYQGSKAGFELMNSAVEQLSQYKKVALWVLKGNEKAIQFYKKYGFVFDGTEKEIILETPNAELRMIYEFYTPRST